MITSGERAALRAALHNGETFVSDYRWHNDDGKP